MRILRTMLIVGTCVFLALTCKKKDDDSSSGKEIVSFSIENQLGDTKRDSANLTISLVMPYNTDLSALKPSVVVSDKASVSPVSGDAVDFTSGAVVYTVTAEDGSKSEWSVSVVTADNSDAEILSFSIANQSDETYYKDDSIFVKMPAGTDLSTVVPNIQISPGASISPAAGVVTDFSNGLVNYVVTAADGTTKTWVTRVTVLSIDILSFAVTGQVGETIIDSNYIEVQVSSTTDLSSIIPQIDVSEDATVSPASGVAVNFSENVTIDYTVTSGNGLSKTYKVLVYKKYPVISGTTSASYQFVGRTQVTSSATRMWASGAYVLARFKGSYCAFAVKDVSVRTFFEVVVDDTTVMRCNLKKWNDTILVSKTLSKGEHTILICKNTEAAQGYFDFVGLSCEELLTPPDLPERKIECIGNSITCGAECDTRYITCAARSWWGENHNAYYSYGARTARALGAQWHLTSVSGIGLIQSCCSMTYVMPDVFGKVSIQTSGTDYDFSQYVPDVVTICLGQNDGIQDSATFCSAYVTFLETLRSKYPDAKLVCLTSPMASGTLLVQMKKYLASIVDYKNNNGDVNVYKFYFSKTYNSGCVSHPSLSQHGEIALELETYLKTVMGW